MSQATKVFISSTSSDLGKYRQIAIDVCTELSSKLNINFSPVVMEYFAAMPGGAAESCKQKMDESELYVGIFAFRYGSTDERDGRSFTEIEYDYACERNMDRLCFFADPNQKRWPAGFREEDSLERQRAFKAKIEKAHVRKLFTGLQNFREQLKDSLIAWHRQHREELEPPPGSLNRPIPWNQVKELCQRSSDKYLTSLRKKYAPALYVKRRVLDEHIDRFLNQSDASYLVLSGKSGLGKTAFLCSLDERFRNHEDIACLTLDSGSLFHQATDQVSRPLVDALSDHSVEDEKDFDLALRVLLDRIECDPGFKNQKLLIIADAINEHENMNLILGMLAGLQSAKSRAWIKAVISCRPHVVARINEQLIERIQPRALGGNYFNLDLFYQPDSGEWYVEVGGFTAEEAAEAYQKHQQFYDFQPERYEDLSVMVQERLKEPLLLWLVSEICHGRKETVSQKLVGTDLSVIPTYVKHLLATGLNLPAHLRTTDQQKSFVRILEQTIPDLMIQDNRCGNTIERSRAQEKHKLGLQTFLDNGILEEIVDEEHAYIRFRFERFYDYYFGKYLKQLASQDVQLDCQPETWFRP